ncbi:MAG: phosphate acyltransferase PlsX [Proteobacteria bacterium]|nr:phosphate acyltransferase PlsX [Pseudomonadota bacterium]
MKIALDAMGGDYAPQVEIEGAIQAATELNISLTLVGNKEVLESELEKRGATHLPITVQNATEVVAMHESPSTAVRKKKDSSIRVAFDLVRRGEADAAVSAGNSGATMATAMFALKRLAGVDRPAIATVMPTLKGNAVVLDVGGNVECKPTHLAQFAVMGEVYAKYVLGIDNPRVGLLSNGSEEEKGTETTRRAHAMLKNSSLNYAGYIEGRDIYDGSIDVVACDGFVGNVVLKVSEGLADAMGKMLKEELGKSLLAKAGFLLAKKSFKQIKKRMDYAEYGGAPLLGINGVGFICHGGSNAKAIKNAIRYAAEYVQANTNKHLLEELEKNGSFKDFTARAATKTV